MNMKLKNPKTESYHDYWDEGQRGTPYPWFKKGWWKRNGRKRFIKNTLKEIDKE